MESLVQLLVLDDKRPVSSYERAISVQNKKTVSSNSVGMSWNNTTRASWSAMLLWPHLCLSAVALCFLYLLSVKTNSCELEVVLSVASWQWSWCLAVGDINKMWWNHFLVQIHQQLPERKERWKLELGVRAEFKILKKVLNMIKICNELQKSEHHEARWHHSLSAGNTDRKTVHTLVSQQRWTSSLVKDPICLFYWLWYELMRMQHMESKSLDCIIYLMMKRTEGNIH